MPTNQCYQCGKLIQQLNADLSKQRVINIKKGHIAKVRWSSQAGMVPQKQEETHPVHQVEQEDNSEVYTT